jgi:hypothetical protein
MKEKGGTARRNRHKKKTVHCFGMTGVGIGGDRRERPAQYVRKDRGHIREHVDACSFLSNQEGDEGK